MIRNVLVILFAVFIAIPGRVVADDDSEAGQNLSTICAPCHGATGISPNELWPKLAGQGHAYIVKQLKAFREGTRNDPVMQPIAQMLSDQDIENLAVYFSAQTADCPETDQ